MKKETTKRKRKKKEGKRDRKINKLTKFLDGYRTYNAMNDKKEVKIKRNKNKRRSNSRLTKKNQSYPKT